MYRENELDPQAQPLFDTEVSSQTFGANQMEGCYTQAVEFL
jgi:hypothetical protein